MTKLKRTQLYAVALFCSLLLLTLLTNFVSTASRQSDEEIASEGLRITPAGSLVTDQATGQPAVGSLPVDFVRSPDHTGRDNQGRYLISVNSGYGVQFNATDNKGQQSIAIIDLNAKAGPAVIQNVYFPTPQSVNVGVVFSPIPDKDGTYEMYVSGGVENKIWIFQFTPGNAAPIGTASAPGSKVTAPFIDIGGFATTASTPRYNHNYAPVYPAGLAISADGNSLFVANNLGDSLGVIEDLHGARRLLRVDLKSKPGQEQSTYPYAVVAWSSPKSPGNARTDKVYVSCWNAASVAVFSPSEPEKPVAHISTGNHPTALRLNSERTRLYVANSNDDTVSVIDTSSDKEIERIDVRLAEKSQLGNTPEGLALEGDTLYVANAHSNSIAVVKLSAQAGGLKLNGKEDEKQRSTVIGFIPTGQYPSAIAVADHTIMVGNGKGTGVQKSSVVVNNSGRFPNAPNDRFAVGASRTRIQGGQYSVSLVSGNVSSISAPDENQLAQYTQQVMRNNGLLGSPVTRLFPGPSPIKHIIYLIKENRTYDQVFGDLQQSGNGTTADGDASLAIFGAGDAAARPDGSAQDITPNHRALALRFGLFDRFFVNSEASPDGHNWCTAAFSSDYVDKAYRWQYSDRGRGYDYDGFNRLPDYEPQRGTPSLFGPSVEADDVANFMKRFIPYLHGENDVAEPKTLYLWDAAARAGLSYRNYGEFVATLSEADIAAIRNNLTKSYPDVSSTIRAFPTKKSLEDHFNKSFHNFDLSTPDSITIDSYTAAKKSDGRTSPLISRDNPEQRFRGQSRLSSWLDEFHSYVNDREAGKADGLPNLSILSVPNDHTDGLKARRPTPQFFVADNDYAVGVLVDAVSHSPYWKDTAIFVVEDDAQDGPDHVDAHRSVALVISAYNRPGTLVHHFHSTVSLIRTIELLLGIQPMNQLDANAIPIDIFRAEPDLTPYNVRLPNVSLDNLITPPPRDTVTAYWMSQSERLNLSHPDMADSRTLNQIIWFSARGNASMPTIARLPVFDAMRLGLREEREEMARNERGQGPLPDLKIRSRIDNEERHSLKKRR